MFISICFPFPDKTFPLFSHDIFKLIDTSDMSCCLCDITARHCSLFWVCTDG